MFVEIFIALKITLNRFKIHVRFCPSSTQQRLKGCLHLYNGSDFRDIICKEAQDYQTAVRGHCYPWPKQLEIVRLPRPLISNYQRKPHIPSLYQPQLLLRNVVPLFSLFDNLSDYQTQQLLGLIFTDSFLPFCSSFCQLSESESQTAGQAPGFLNSTFVRQPSSLSAPLLSSSPIK